MHIVIYKMIPHFLYICQKIFVLHFEESPLKMAMIASIVTLINTTQKQCLVSYYHVALSSVRLPVVFKCHVSWRAFRQVLCASFSHTLALTRLCGNLLHTL